MKICTNKQCLKEKPLSEFHKNKNYKDGYSYWCKDCVKNKNKEHYVLKIDYYKNQSHNYYIKNKEEILQKNKEYRVENQYKIKESRKKYYDKNRGKIALQCKKSYQLTIKPKRLKNPEICLLKSINDRCYNKNCKGYQYYGDIENYLTLDDIRFLMKRDNYWSIKRPSIERKNSKGDYTLENCEFIDRGENTARRNREHCSKSMLQYDLQGNFIKEWKSTQEVERILGYYHSSTSRVARNEQKTAYGFIWKYK